MKEFGSQFFVKQIILHQKETEKGCLLDTLLACFDISGHSKQSLAGFNLHGRCSMYDYPSSPHKLCFQSSFQT